MSDFKNLSDEDVRRIERGIVYSFPARDGTGLIICVGTYGDLTNQVRIKDCASIVDFLPMATDRLTYWFCNRIDGILSGEEVAGSTGWSVIDGKPVSPPAIASIPGTASYIESRPNQYPAGMDANNHDSDCSTNNRGVPELLGPYDCSLSKVAQ